MDRTWSAGGLIDDGLVGLVDAVAEVHEQIRAGMRVLSIRVAGGLAVDVLPDRGLDIGSTWWGDVPLAWRSPNPVDPGAGFGWEERFLGGLLATCGPDNIGEPRGSAGQHGTHHLSHAFGVSWERVRVGDEVEVRVRGSVAHSSLTGPRVVVERTIAVMTGKPEVRVEDVVRNVGDQAWGVPLLYHVNLGAPVLRPGSTVQVDAVDVVTREPLPDGRAPGVLPPPQSRLAPVVAEHRGVRSVDGAGRAVVIGPGGPAVEVVWTLDTVPRLNTWTWPTAGAWVLGVEPSNAPLFGDERDSMFAGAPVLDPGQSWRTGIRIAVLDNVGEAS